MNSVDIFSIIKKLWAKRKLFFTVWLIVFGLSVLWVMPQPRYYKCNVSLAPEMTGENIGGISSLASNFGINLGGQGSDAIYPQLYPELFRSPDFIVGLFSIKIKMEEGNEELDYATYLKKYQKKNWLTAPFNRMKSTLIAFFDPPKKDNLSANHKTNPFFLTESEYKMMEKIGAKISCSIDQRTDVVTISVKDQDRLVCALVADSVRQHLQDFIIAYRTKKARLDVLHYQSLADSYKKEYDESAIKYSRFCDANRNVILQTAITERNDLENDMQMKYNAYSAIQTQLEAAKVKLQEKTPAFTTLQSATVPQKPAGPKRLMFVAFMLILSTIVTTAFVLKSEMRSLLVFYKQ